MEEQFDNYINWEANQQFCELIIPELRTGTDLKTWALRDVIGEQATFLVKDFYSFIIMYLSLNQDRIALLVTVVSLVSLQERIRDENTLLAG